MHGIREWIEEHFRKAQEEYEQGRYDNAEAELNIIRGKIKEEIQKIKATSRKEDLREVAARYHVLSDMIAYSKRANSRLELVRAEKDRSRRFRSIVKGMYERRVIDAIKKNREMVEEFRDRDRTINEKDRFVKILRRWNSYTPLLCLDVIENLGGGYFLAWDGTGIVVDPGINFIRNAISAGLSIKDVDNVVLTHSHVDHTSDFEGLVTLFHEINAPRYDLGLDPIQFSLYASIGAVNKYCNLISLSYDTFKEVSVVNPNSSYRLSDSIYLKTTPCQHKDLFCSHPSSCVGLKFYSDEEPEPIFAITSDTGYHSQLKGAFADLEDNLVILHIGGIKDEEKEYIPPPNIPLYKSHLGLRGVLNFIFDIKPSVAVISEFGEEFRGTRMGISGLFDQEFGVTKVIPADVGFTIEFSRTEPRILVACNNCHSKVPIANIQVRLLEKGSNLVYLCPDCFHKKEEEQPPKSSERSVHLREPGSG